MPIEQVHVSDAFPPSENGSTTWITGTLPDGRAFDTTLEYLHDMPTQLVVGGHGSISGDYHAFAVAQQGGKATARLWAMRHGENCGDNERTFARRQRLFLHIQRHATDVPLTGRRHFKAA